MSPKGMTHTAAVQIGPVRIGIRTNHPAHLPDLTTRIEVKSLLTDFFRIEETAFSQDLDGYLHIRESQAPPQIRLDKNLIRCRGPFLDLAEKASDDRYSFWGNLGLLYRFTLYLLETCYGIFNLHACALFSPQQEILYVVAGGAGSGKTVYLLSGIELGLQLFSTETVHIQIREENTTWHIGSLLDNIRWGTLLQDFPRFRPDSSPPPPERIWQEKVAVDLSPFRWKERHLQDPEVVFLFPHIEQGRKDFVLTPLSDPKRAAHRLFDNASEKITPSFILFDEIAVTGFDNPRLARQRLSALQKLVRRSRIRLIASVLADPGHCWGDLLSNNPPQGEIQ